ISLRYARTVALDHALAHRPDLRERLEPELTQWLSLTTQAVLKGYRKGVAKSGVLPAKEAGVQRLLDLFMIIRSVHALRHELENRPEMVPAAIDALWDQLRGSF